MYSILIYDLSPYSHWVIGFVYWLIVKSQYPNTQTQRPNKSKDKVIVLMDIIKIKYNLIIINKYGNEMFD